MVGPGARRPAPRRATGGLADRGRRVAGLVAGLVAGALLAACDPGAAPTEEIVAPVESAAQPEPTTTRPPAPPPRPRGTLTLGFAGDVHFEWHLAGLLEGDPRGRLGPITDALRRPDVMIANLETAITTRGTPVPKEFTFRAAPAALDLLDAAGVDVVTMANNHGVDFGAVGLRDTLDAVREGPLPVVGIGRNATEAFRPHRVRVGRTTVSVFGVSQRPDYTSFHWAAGPRAPGIALAIEPRPRLLGAVRRADAAGEVVVVYLHWGLELKACPTPRQREMAAALAKAGADVIVGSHAHVLLGSGWLGDAYVNYGLANFVWYNTYRPDTGVVTVRIRDGEVVADDFAPAVIADDGRPFPLTGPARDDAVRAWEGLRGCAGLAGDPPAAS